MLVNKSNREHDTTTSNMNLAIVKAVNTSKLFRKINIEFTNQLRIVGIKIQNRFYKLNFN